MLPTTFPKYYHRKLTSAGTVKENVASSGSVFNLVTDSNFSADKDMCASSAPSKSDYVYKRRRKNEKCVTFFSEQAAIDSKGGDSLLPSLSTVKLLSRQQKYEYADEIPEPREPIPSLPCEKNHNQILGTEIHEPIFLNSNSNSDSFNGPVLGEDKRFAQPCIDFCRKLTLENSTNVNDRCSSSKSHVERGSIFSKTEADDIAECSSSEFVVSEILRRNSSENIVKRSYSSADTALIDCNTSCSKVCMICGGLDYSQNMLICDFCEKSFHLSCCNPHVKRTPRDEWYCQACMKKKPKSLLGATACGKTLNSESDRQDRKRVLQIEHGPILFMLKDTEPYTTGVRIGKSFQADVPDWSGPSSDDTDKFGEPFEVNLVERDILNNSNQSSRHNSIGNWIQCREVIYRSPDDDQGVVCGKWRRAPLFEAQTDDWDCSCAVVWDPFHADCAVPQELPTPEVKRHLNYVELLRPRLAARQSKLS